MFLAAAKRTPVDLHEWAIQMMERHNRKSHLAPQLSPSTQALLRGETASPGLPTSLSNASKTPTSGDIPIVEDYARPTLPAEMVTAPADINGSGLYQPQSVTFDRSGFPPRSSSTLAQTSSKPRESENVTTTSRFPPRESSGFASTILPIRNAGPPSGALPQPPDTAFRTASLRQPPPNTSSYADGYQSQY